MDYYFENEWLNTQQQKSDYLNVRVAFSRDQEQKVYAQDKLLENASEIFHLINEKNCAILIAGNSKRMPEDVLAILEKVIQNGLENSNTSSSNESNKNYVKSLQLKNRIQMETWS